MRTTLTLDDDVAADLERLRKAGGRRHRDVVNEALRLGLKQMLSAPKRPRKGFRTTSVSLGACRIQGLDNISEALAIAERESFR